jgi:putative ABC transport system permease protein
MKTPELVSAYSPALLTNDKMFAYKNGKRIPLTIRFTDGYYWKLVDLEFLEGRGYFQEEIPQDDRIVVIDRKTRNVYFEGEACVGKYIMLRGVSHRVVGVVENVDGLRFSAYSNIWAPYTHTKHVEWNYFGSLQIAFLAKDASDILKIKSEFASMLTKVEFLDDYYDSIRAEPMRMTMDLWRDEDTYQATMGQFVHIEDAPKVIFAVLIIFYLFLPGLNLISLNSTRILERFPEIGARKAFGATTRQLATQFIIENIIITLLGAFIACILTWLVIFLFNQANYFANSQISPSYMSFVIGTLAALFLAILSGITPSIRLAKTKIVDTLKSSTK